MKRSQVILDDDNDRRLRELASREGKSISEIVRQILDAYFAERERKEREKALEVLRTLDQIREQTARYGVYEGDPVNEARDERDAEIEDVWRQWS
ncbi:ribbon-helix-helix protein, CopG family [Thermanaerothrix sp.]|uniref:ribbon-helix-helix protein, CopG family n=1 Tax=Thermanaerothrix sp. TaxID=2972675 RepID=UPI002ADD957E|nr:ribbon-helix-helix protein, CopG family [Thermanaerothrix sp.]